MATVGMAGAATGAGAGIGFVVATGTDVTGATTTGALGVASAGAEFTPAASCSCIFCKTAARAAACAALSVGLAAGFIVASGAGAGTVVIG